MCGQTSDEEDADTEELVAGYLPDDPDRNVLDFLQVRSGRFTSLCGEGPPAD
jgi:hypothetical protein